MGLEDPTQTMAKPFWHESTERRRSFSTAVAEGGATVVGLFRTESRRRSDSRNHPQFRRSDWLRAN